MRTLFAPVPALRGALLLAVVLAPLTAAGQAVAASHAKSGPHAIDACGAVNQAALEQALGQQVKPQRVPPNTPTSAGVSVCMYATASGRQTLSVTTYSPDAVSRTHARTLQGYYDSVKTANANLVGKPPQVLPGVARHASYFVNPRNAGDVILILRRDCVVTINVAGLKNKEEAHAVAKTAGR